MENFYITENILIKDNKTFYSNPFNKIKINKNNWHIYLKEYGWEKIPKSWIIKLNKLSSKKNKNSKFGILDCEKDGNCFFQCVANAFNEKYRYDGIQYNFDDIRKLIADLITEDIYINLIKYYRIMKDADDFDEKWDPHSIRDINEFKSELRKSGNNYWGDYLILNTITKLLKLNIFILNSNEETKECNIYNTLNNYKSKYDTIFLLFVDGCHFKLIGSFENNQMISYFNDNNIPEEFIKLLNLK